VVGVVAGAAAPPVAGSAGAVPVVVSVVASVDVAPSTLAREAVPEDVPRIWLRPDR
jgi:hypothetical protein